MSRVRIVDDESKYPVQPEHIDASRHLFESFDHSETETSAGWLVRFAQERGKSWAPFTRKELEAYYHKKFAGMDFHFNRLIDPQTILAKPAKEFARMAQHAKQASGKHPVIGAISYALVNAREPAPAVEKGGGWIIESKGKFYFTHDFIARCYKSSPGGIDDKGVGAADLAMIS